MSIVLYSSIRISKSDKLLAFLFVFACIFIGLGSLRLTAISILPNVLPVLAAFAAMGALGIPLDAATVMVASIGTSRCGF